jgi:protein-S-isoprenylcysteine O-methyltransferase Ste14
LRAAAPSLFEKVFRFRGPLLAATAIPIASVALMSPPPELLDIVLAAVAIACGLALRISAVRWIGKRARVRVSGAAVLLCEGPFARVRNPLYLANLLVVAGASLAAGLGPWSAAVAAYALIVYHVVVLAEETTLRELFGELYDRYRELVPRWIPRLSPARLDRPSPERHPWSEVLAREARTVAGTLAVVPCALLLRAGPVAALVRSAFDVASARTGLAVPALATAIVAVIAAIDVARIEAKHRRHERHRALHGGG